MRFTEPHFLFYIVPNDLKISSLYLFLFFLKPNRIYCRKCFYITLKKVSL